MDRGQLRCPWVVVSFRRSVFVERREPERPKLDGFPAKIRHGGFGESRILGSNLVDFSCAHLKFCKNPGRFQQLGCWKCAEDDFAPFNMNCPPMLRRFQHHLGEIAVHPFWNLTNMLMFARKTSKSFLVWRIRCGFSIAFFTQKSILKKLDKLVVFMNIYPWDINHFKSSSNKFPPSWADHPINPPGEIPRRCPKRLTRLMQIWVFQARGDFLGEIVIE